MDFPEMFKYQVDKNAPLPTGQPVEKINEEAYPEDYHGPQESSEAHEKIYPKKLECLRPLISGGVCNTIVILRIYPIK